MNGYDLSRSFWNFAFENPEKIKPTHISIYFFAIEHCNRLGWKEKFGFPTSMVLEGIGIKSYSVYKKAFDELVSFGFIEVVEYSKNQFSSNIIALKEYCKANYKAPTKALDKALIKHASKHLQSTYQSTYQSNHQSTLQSTVSIDKQLTKNKEQGTKEQEKPSTGVMILSLKDFEKEIKASTQKLESAARRNRTNVEKILSMVPDFIDTCYQKDKVSDTWQEYCNYFANWLLTEFSKQKNSTQTKSPHQLREMNYNEKP